MGAVTCVIVCLLIGISAGGVRVKRQIVGLGGTDDQIELTECFNIWKQETTTRLGHLNEFVETFLRNFSSRIQGQAKIEEIVDDQTWRYLQRGFSTDLVDSAECRQQLRATTQALEESTRTAMTDWLVSFRQRLTLLQRFWQSIVDMFSGK